MALCACHALLKWTKFQSLQLLLCSSALPPMIPQHIDETFPFIFFYDFCHHLLFQKFDEIIMSSLPRSPHVNRTPCLISISEDSLSATNVQPLLFQIFTFQVPIPQLLHMIMPLISAFKVCNSNSLDSQWLLLLPPQGSARIIS